MVLKGHCNCNAVHIEVDDGAYTPLEPLTCVYCHCSTCKRQSGGSGTYLIIVDDGLIKIDGECCIKTWHDTESAESGEAVDRNYCGVCACPITAVSPLYPGKTIVKMGLFDTIPKAVAEIYTRNKQIWEPTVINADQVKGGPPS